MYFHFLHATDKDAGRFNIVGLTVYDLCRRVAQ